MLGGIIGIFMVGFGILWTVFAAQISPVFSIFGLLWTGIAIATTVYRFKNATGKNRYSEYDITDSSEEPDPFNERFGNYTQADFNSNSKFCPYCGTPVADDFEFCNNCGRKLP